ncbi:hypothetical protein PR202_ga29654 [Eleusine coracana subsp. coracana]|uniref:Uncharacterized protein n=1 Tax=Eleusine coracana subsp. coracana TaxID=191504 RepID=A0AAV5DK68_ELECO|nr:hypothetical protein PR202_ga29654 [Eleusine coracana subsp. coracana]
MARCSHRGRCPSSRQSARLAARLPPPPPFVNAPLACLRLHPLLARRSPASTSTPACVEEWGGRIWPGSHRTRAHEWPWSSPVRAGPPARPPPIMARVVVERSDRPGPSRRKEELQPQPESPQRGAGESGATCEATSHHGPSRRGEKRPPRPESPQRGAAAPARVAAKRSYSPGPSRRGEEPLPWPTSPVAGARHLAHRKKPMVVPLTEILVSVGRRPDALWIRTLALSSTAVTRRRPVGYRGVASVAPAFCCAHAVCVPDGATLTKPLARCALRWLPLLFLTSRRRALPSA